MPKPLLFKTAKQQTGERSENLLHVKPQQQQKQQSMEKLKVDRLLRKPRSKKYIETVKKLDAGGHVHNQYKVDAIIQNLSNEFPELSLAGMLEGIISKCYLGDPYEVHSVDITGGIIQHFKRGEVMPGKMEEYRGMACQGNYEFIEIYNDCVRAVSSNGSVAVIKRK